MRRLLVAVLVIGVLAAAGFGAYRLAGSTTTAMSDNTLVVPTTRVTRGPLELAVRMNGELRATRQMQVTAPATGGNLRILSMSETGEEVEEGDPLMEFDPAEQQFLLEQARSELLEAEQEIIKRQAELEVQAAQDKVTLLTAQFDVRRAELDAKVDETMVSANDAKIRQVSLEQARRNLTQVQADVKSRLTTTKSALAILNERKMRATMSADRAQQSIDNLVLKSPMTGVVVVQGNMDTAGGMMMMGMSMPPYRVGDTAMSGRLVVEVYDIASMEIRARVNEQERANLAVGQQAKITSDAVAGVEQIAKITSIAGLGRADSRSGPMRQFDVILMLEKPDPRLRPGTTVSVTAQGQKVDDALVLPRQSVFEKDGKSIVFAKDGAGFTPREVKIAHRTESRVAITGIDAGVEVALVDPDKIGLPAKPAAAPPSPPPVRREWGSDPRRPELSEAAPRRRRRLSILPEIGQGLDNLLAHKLRSVLTMLGMIFGVAAVIAMLSIGAGAQQQVIAFIEQLGVRNIIIEARETTDNATFVRIRKLSTGLTFRDLRMIEAGVDGLVASSARKRWVPSKVLPRPLGDIPAVFGVSPSYQAISNLTTTKGRFFTEDEAKASAPVAVLGQAAAVGFFGPDDPLDRFLKINDQWYRVVGVAAPRLAAQGDVGGLPAQDYNNIIYIPIGAAILRLEDNQSYYRDEIDAIYLHLSATANVTATGTLVRGLLETTHKGAGDFTVVVPAELLAQQQRTKRLFEFVMVAIASISLLVGGIGIMNIMLASVMERTREIGVRRAIGATRRDVIRQFLIETTLITITGGFLGTLVGVGLSQLVGYFAGWSTIVTGTSVAVASIVSVVVGIVFGLYPAVRAARLDPVAALHYE